MDILIATTNKGKIKEINTLLDGIPLRLLTPDMLGLNMEVAETGSTYAENAALKATAFARAAHLLTLADDSGLEVEILEGAPGLHSARYVPKPGATDADRRAYLLQNLRLHPQPWRARFVCVVSIVEADGTTAHFSEGECRGVIIPEERGTNGFGYDPVFYLPESGKTMAELSMAEKNTLSHRARAIQAARDILLQLISQK